MNCMYKYVLVHTYVYLSIYVPTDTGVYARTYIYTFQQRRQIGLIFYLIFRLFRRICKMLDIAVFLYSAKLLKKKVSEGQSAMLIRESLIHYARSETLSLFFFSDN